jgi:hypothetical protein
VIQLTRTGTICTAAERELDELRSEFERRHCVKLPGLIEPALLERILSEIDQADFFRREHALADAAPAVELCMEPNTASALLLFLVSGDDFFRAIQAITGCGKIGSFDGRVYRMMPTSEHEDQWHTDTARGRMIAMSLNLSREPYEGGVLQIRQRGSWETIEASNKGLGDAMLFRVAPGLEHRVGNVEGVHGRTAFAGWFIAEADQPTTARQRLFGRDEA